MANLLNGEFEPGKYSAQFSGMDILQDILLPFAGDGKTATGKMVLLK
ncbi:MAG: hypothetical protein IPJ75_16285 [Ignavibacteriales bacterium]|nr:hypothetical protein [Ignavibacteriales bacterium]